MRSPLIRTSTENAVPIRNLTIVLTVTKLKYLWNKYEKNELMKITSSSGIYEPYMIMVTFYSHLERANYKFLKSHIIIFFIFIKRLPLLSAALQKELHFKASKSNKRRWSLLEKI